MADPFVLETRGLTKEFNGFIAVSSVDLQVRRGQIHALIGPNGAGKTTCFNLLTRFLTPTRGQIIYKGEDITGAKAAEIARRGIVRSFQVSAVFPHLTVLENVRVALQRTLGTTFHFWKRASTRKRWSYSMPSTSGLSPARPLSSCLTDASAHSKLQQRSRWNLS
jgi:branched-chain amino acid transport system ATP-binding protein